jgi:integrase
VARRHFGWVRKRNSGRWQIVYWHDGTRRSGGTYETKASAQAALAQIQTDIRRGVWIDVREGDLSVAQYAKVWLSHRPDLAVRTRELYAHLFNLYINPELGHISLNKLAPSKVREWNAELARRIPSSAAKSYRLLSTMMRTAVEDGRISKSPCVIRGASVEHAPERPIATPAEVERLAKAMPAHMQLLVMLACWCQLRRGELLGLRRADVDLEEGTLKVERSRTFARNGTAIEKRPKTSAGLREIAIPPTLLPLIQSHLDRFSEDGEFGLVFVGERGAPLTAGVLQKAWSISRDKVGRPDLHFHDLRHSGLTFAAEAGATTAELMHRAGHSSSSAALRYQHATQERDRALASLLEERISK